MGQAVWRLGLFLLVGQLWAQGLMEKQLPQFEVQDVLSTIGELSKVAPSFSDGVVDPHSYVVGPGDIFLLQVTGVLAVDVAAVVSPDGMLSLPRLSALAVGGKTLAMVKREVQAAYRRYNPDLKVVLSLLQPRRVVVAVEGDVQVPGNYLFPANVRVSTAVRLVQMAVQQEQRKQRLSGTAELLALKTQWQQERIRQEGAPFYFVPYSERHLLLVRQTGEVLEVDPLRGKLDDPAFDPCLRENDRIIVPYTPLEYPCISVAGDVPAPTIFPYRQGDHLALALQIAAVDSLPVGSEIIVRNGQQVQHYQWQGAQSLEEFRKILLVPGAAVIVQTPGSTQEQETVAAVIGFVQFPGVYPITPGKTRVSTVLAAAGQVQPQGSLRQGYILRQGAFQPYHPAELYELVHLLRGFPVEYFDTTHYRIDVLARREIVLTDLQQAVEQPGSEADVLLEPGDVVVVPKAQHMVYVFGQVHRAGYVPYQPGKTVAWYLDQAGGLNPMAEEDEIQVWKAAGKGWIPAEETIIEPGDKIYVPRQAVRSTAERMQIFGVIMGLASSAAFLISTVINLLSR